MSATDLSYNLPQILFVEICAVYCLFGRPDHDRGPVASRRPDVPRDNMRPAPAADGGDLKNEIASDLENRLPRNSHILYLLLFVPLATHPIRFG